MNPPQPPNPLVRTRIKICGVRDPATAQAAVQAGADAIGLVFAPGSPRLISLEQARQIIDVLPPFVEPVGLFVNRPSSEINDVAQRLGLRTVQLHGHEPPEIIEKLRNLRVIKALPFDPARLPQIVQPWQALLHRGGFTAVLWDTPPQKSTDDYPENSAKLPGPGAIPGLPAGGGGRTFDWELLAHAQRSGSLTGLPAMILAGGLTPQNAAQAIIQIRPYAVDVSTGVESSRGVKDPALIRAFCSAARTADASNES